MAAAALTFATCVWRWVQLDLSKLTAVELDEQKEHLRQRVLAWLSGIPIGAKGAESTVRRYDTRPLCRFAEVWNLYHLDVEVTAPAAPTAAAPVLPCLDPCSPPETSVTSMPR